MRKFIGTTLAIVMLIPASYTVNAGECAINYVRTACSGQEETSYKKCDGKKECTKMKTASSAEECREVATESCRNSRLDITKSKVITAKFNGETIQTASGKDDFCLEYKNRSTEFDQCDK
jgi:hypothetical protein